MVLFTSWRDEAGILSTQVGDPRAHRQEGCAHAASFDGLSGAAVSAVSHCEDEDVAEFRFWFTHFPEGWGDSDATAELRPEGERALSLFGRFPSIDCGGERQRRAEVSDEIQLGGTSKSVQGLACG